MACYEASVRHCFTARHAVALPGGLREPSHEHLWQVTARFRSRTLEEPMAVVIDFVAVQDALRTVTSDLEGRDLNALDAFADGRTSAERVAEYLSGRLMKALAPADRLYCVEVTEAEGCVAAYYPKG